MNTLHVFQNTIFRWILLTGLPVMGFSWCISGAFAKGFLLGLGAGCLGLMLKLRLARRLIRRQSFRTFPGALISMGACMAALYGGYRADVAQDTGILGAFSGMLLVPLLLMGLGITGWDLRPLSLEPAVLPDQSTRMKE